MRLRTKLLLPLLLIGLLIAAYLRTVWIPHTLAADEAAHLRAVDQHLNSVADSLVPLLLGNQLDILHGNLDTLRQANADWHDIRLLNPEGKLLYPLATRASSPAPEPGPDIRTMRKTIRYLDRPLGDLVVQLDLEPSLQNTRKEIRELTLVLLGVLVLLTLTILVSTEIMVRRPVRQLAAAANRLAKMDFGLPLPPAGRDEIGELVGSFALMRNDLQGTLEQIISVLSRAIEQRDPYTDGHQKRVSLLATAIAEEMGLPADTVTGIRLGSLVHDVGKIRIPAEILHTPRALSETEMDIIRTHPDAGAEILAGATFPWPVIRMVLEHHERLDGSGYPKGLKGEEICLEARIIAVADVVEATTTFRPYRPAFGLDVALKDIRDGRGTLFDPDAVDSCIRVFERNGFRFFDLP